MEWLTYLVPAPEADGEATARIDAAGRCGVVEISAITVKSAAGDRVLLPPELDSVRCAGSLTKLPDGRFLVYGEDARLIAPVSGFPACVEIRVRFTGDLTLVAEAMESMQAERLALAAEYRNLKGGEHSARAVEARLHACLEAERKERRELEKELTALQDEAAIWEYSRSRLERENEEREAMAEEIERLHRELKVSRGRPDLVGSASEALERERAALVQANRSLARERDELRQSLSWKLTAPVRKILGFAMGKGPAV